MNAYLAEFLGTAILILFGNGVVANVCLKQTKGNSSGWIVITTAWAFAVFVAVVIAGPYSGAHLNPAVTIAFAVKGAFSWADVPLYILAQIAGGFIGGLLVFLSYKDHFYTTEEEGLKRACFCTEPAIRQYSSNFLSEFLATFAFIFIIFYLVGSGEIVLPQTTEATPIGLGSLGALPVSFLVWAVGLSLGGTTGYAINPARDFGPRLTLALLSNKLKTSPDWQYAWVPIVGPIVGAICAALFYQLVMSFH
ncbi:MIP/aquaporin family protein [Conservatibacter flavescens]|uniref:Aquaporin n=1 Tax=Conservatibacter flavescens TaxID=28161 RepID=A0A2M8S1Y8_9PAST|nr:MIP/aquaporin family protein [Conservatibacter flavescens]PJG85163.1 aquaporin [Conservatibacter flavescens]